jgi:hypothetical protein
VTFCDLDRDMARVGIQCEEDRDARAWQNKDKDRRLGTRHSKENKIEFVMVVEAE